MTYSIEFIDILLYLSTNIRRVIELTHLYNQSRDLTLVTKPGRVNTRGRYVRHLRFVRIFCQLFVYFATILCVIQMNPKYIKLLFYYSRIVENVGVGQCFYSVIQIQIYCWHKHNYSNWQRPIEHYKYIFNTNLHNANTVRLLIKHLMTLFDEIFFIFYFG